MFENDSYKENKPRTFPPQRKKFSQKGKAWRKECVQWAIDSLYSFGEVCRKSTRAKRINLDLLNGKLHMDDLEYIANPSGIESDYISDEIQHYAIMNSKLNILRGEELARVFDYSVIVTNPNAISDAEDRKKAELFARLQAAIENESTSEEQYQQEVERLAKYYAYEWQDIKELQGNALLHHYSKEYNFPMLFNNGFMTAMWAGEEIYQCDIVGGEPAMNRVNPFKLQVFMSGYSNKIEDADMIIYDDFWSPGRIYDTFYDVLTEKDMKYIESRAYNDSEATDIDYDTRDSYVPGTMIDDTISIVDGEFVAGEELFKEAPDEFTFLPYDMAGNIRVTRVYWKSRRLVKKVKFYDPMTGEVDYKIMPESYLIDEAAGEEEEDLWVNEAWEGTRIGRDTYVNMRPCPIQYNSISNPSKCHFGFVGSIYNLNDSKPFSMVDIMKPYNYLYDVIHDRLNRLLARNMGKLVRLDLSKIPQSKGWDVDKWLYFAKTCGIAVEDSFNEGDYGASTGKLAGGLNNASTGVIDAELGNTIQQYMQLLEFIKQEMSEVAGISKQREGQISNRETVGGVERATLQSSHITEWLFAIHDDVKKRALECFLETAKIAMKGGSKKFQYIIPGWTKQVVEIDGNEFAEADYGIVVDNSREVQELRQKLDMLAQAGLQNQMFNFSTVLQLYSSCSLSEKTVIMKQSEAEAMQRAQEQQMQQQQLAQQQMQLNAEMEQAKMQQTDMINQRDNETKLLIANIQALGKRDADGDGVVNEGVDTEDLAEKIREFDEKLKLDRDKFEYQKQKDKQDNKTKLEIANMKAKSSTNKK